MRSADPYLAEREMNMSVEAQRRQSQVRGLLRPAGDRQPETLARRGWWLLCELGYLLVALGARLEAHTLAQEA